MVIIRLMGGLGNQMFQHALYLKLKSLGKEVYFDDAVYANRTIEGTLRGQRIDQRIDCYFPVTVPLADAKSLVQIGDASRRFSARIRRKVFGRRGNIYIDKEEGMQPGVFGMDDVYLSGYWVSEKYFSGIEGKVREDFKMKDYLTSYQKSILKKIQKTESVSVHIRRGDYLKYKDVFGGICTEEYYGKAMKYFYRRPGRHFFVFSNDYAYVKEKYKAKENITIVRPEKECPHSNMDMLLMSQCKHNIIANSTFSWWAAWLNSNKEKEVITPKRMINTKNMRDVWCDGWIQM